MSFSIRTLSDYDRFFVVDIGSARVKALLCDLENGELHIRASSSIRQSKKYIIDGEIADISGVCDTVRKVLSKVSEGQPTLPEEIILSIQSSSLVSDTLSMNYVRENPAQTIDMEEIDRMVGRIEARSLERARPKILSRVLESDSAMKLITTALTSITIDGKKVSNPVGFTGENVSLTVCNVFVPSTTFQLYNTIIRNLDLKLISFVPVPIALPKAQESSLELFDPNVFIDIGAEFTTVVLENYSEILGSVVIPFGSNVLSRMFAKRTPTLSNLEREDRIMRHSKNDEALRGALTEFEDFLSDAVIVALRDIAPDFLARNVYVSGGMAYDTFVKSFVALLESKLPRTSLVPLSLIPETEKLSSEYAVSYALARTAVELVIQKRDPIARILRYVIYRYE